jgi:hypothetical protein
MDKMNSIEQDVFAKYKECAGKECRNVGAYYLTVLYLNKSGWFCDHCRNGLISDGLVDGNLQSSPTTGQSLERSGQPVGKKSIYGGESIDG